jgi:hypothetical protein
MNNFWEIYDLKNIINISNNKEIRIAFVKKDNTIGIDVRGYYKKSGEWNHGKGITVPVDKWEEFQKVIFDIKK